MDFPIDRDLLLEYVSHQLDLELLDVTVIFADRIIQKADAGRLYTSAQKRLRIEYQSAPPFGHPPFNSIASKQGLTVRARTEDGWYFETRLFEIRPKNFNLKLGFCSWNAGVLEAYLQRRIEEPRTNSEFFAFIDALDCTFDRNTTYLNEQGESRGGIRDWLQVETDATRSIILQGEGDWSTMSVVARKQLSLTDFDLENKTLLQALSLRMGRRIEPVGTRVFVDRTEQLSFSGFRMSRLRHTGNFPLVPLVMLNNGGTAFIETAQKFFKANKDLKMIKLLFSVWDGEPMSREIHRLQTAIALESMSKYINKLKQKDGKPDTPAEIIRQKEEAEFRTLTKDAEKLLDSMKANPNHLKRLKGVIGRTSLNDATPAIRSAGENLGLAFTAEELKCWRNMRNPAAHGDPENYDPDEKDFWACQSMLYRLVLASIGWAGPRVHYGLDAPPPPPPATSVPIQGPVQVIDMSEVNEISIGWKED